MAKNFNFTFSVNCLLGRNFHNSMVAARNGIISVRKEIDAANKEQYKIGNGLLNGDISQKNWTNQNAALSDRLKALHEKEGKFNNFINARGNLSNATSELSVFAAGVYAAARPLVGIINTAAEFEQGMSKVQAITRANDAEMQLLTSTAKELGRQTQFTARQSADAMSYLGMAGWNTQEIIKGMPGLLSLAAAGGTDLARTADIVSDDLTAFGLSADQAGHMADVFAYTITRTNTNVEMLGETMKYGAPVAHAFGVSMEETAALAGLMANSGIKASQAGTALRSGFLRLAGPPKQAAKAMEALGMNMSEMSKQQAEAQEAMKALGVQMSDINGPRKMSAIITELRTKMQGLSKEERLATVGAIFGKNASTGWLAVLDSAPEKFDQLVNEMDKCDGEADRMAKTMNKNAKGAMIRLQSAMESAAISFGGAFLPALADAGDGLAKFAGLIGDAAEKHPALIQTLGLTAIAMTGTALAMKAAGVVYAAYQVATTAATAGTWSFNAALAANPIGLVVVAVAGLVAAGYALYKNWDTVSAGLVAGWEWVKTTAWNFLTSLPEKAGYAVGYIVGWFRTLPERITGIFKSLDGVGQTFIDKAIEWGKSAVNGLIDGFLALPGRLTGIVSRAWESAKSAFSKGEAAGSAGVTQNATGGIYGRGAFLTTFAEKSGESAIPHTPTKRNIGLLAKTNQIMGNPLQPMLQVSPAFNPTINVTASAPAVNVPPAEVAPASVNVEQAAITAPSPVIQIPESKPILQAPPVVKNIIQAVADSPIVKTFVNAVAAVPEVIVNPASPVMKPSFTAMAQTPVVNPAAVNNVISLPKMDAPMVSPVIQTMAKPSIVPALFDPLVQTAGTPDVNFHDIPAQKETLIERIKELVAPSINRQTASAPPVINIHNDLHFSGNVNQQEVRETVDKASDISFAKFREFMIQYQHEQRRVRYE